MIADNNLASARGVSVENRAFKAGSDVLQRNTLIMGTPLASKAASVAMAVPRLIISPDDGADLYGRGSMLARLIAAFFKGNNYATPCWAFPEAEAATGAVKAAGSIAFVATSSGAGYLYLRVAAVLYKIPVASGLAATAIGDLVEAALTADPDCPVDADNTTGTVALTAKSAGPWGNGISISLNAYPQDGEALPTGVTAAITDMASGAGLPTVAADLAAGLGTGESANEKGFTDVVHGYGKETTILDAILAYVGAGNEAVGLYADTVARPFRVLTGDVSKGSAGLSALISFGDGRKTDRASGCIAAPGRLTHPSEIAAIAIGVMARLNNEAAEASYDGVILPGVDIGNAARLAGDDWTTSTTSRDLAVKAGISPVIVEDGVCKLTNVVSFYHPATIPVNSNAFRSMRNISIAQNMLAAKMAAYKSEEWRAFTVVSDVRKVTNPTSRKKARDRNSVIATELSLIKAFQGRGWLYDDEYSIEALRQAAAIVPRESGNGYKVTTPYILSGEGNVMDVKMYLDTNIAVVSA
jgi:phage tail sheath gpL-like